MTVFRQSNSQSLFDTLWTIGKIGHSMTLRGKNNHFNVKFLKGYGFSIKVKDSKIILKNCYGQKNTSQK